jgi:plastocyanin
MRAHRFPELAIAIFLLLAGAAVPAVATNFTIVTDLPYGYTPSTMTINVGDSVTWMNTSQGYHNVDADDGSFRCANGCDGDGHGGDGDPSYNPWQFTITFTKPGPVSFHCDIHGSMGMVGTITVNQPASNTPGSLSFSQATYSAGDTAGHATINVQRTGGSSGAVAVHYATSNGTAVTGTNYQAASGTLNWASGDSAVKSFEVSVINDGKPDGNHTVDLTLSAPTGGASLGTARATLTIANSNTASAPAAPTNLTAIPLDSTDVQLTWTVNSNDETALHVQSKLLNGGSFQDLPLLPAGTNSLIVSGLQASTGYGFQVRAENAAGASAYTPEADATTSPAPGTPCVADANTLCLGTGGRFQATVNYSSTSGSGAGTAVPLAANPSSGLFYFFAASNIEMLIKVLNACAPPFNDYWVFFAATTNVEFNVTVLDTQTSKVRLYSNPLNQAALPVQDTSAFMTCP